LYPLWRMKESSDLLYQLCVLNPFTYAVELVGYAIYGKFNLEAFLVVLVCTSVFLGLAIYAYNPSKGFLARKGKPG
ncbi:MAG: ABC transporter, partial [Pseudomonadota bacterium]